MNENKNQLYQAYLNSDPDFKDAFPTFDHFDNFTQSEEGMAKVEDLYDTPEWDLKKTRELKKKDGEDSKFRLQFPWDKAKNRNKKDLLAPEEQGQSDLETKFPGFKFGLEPAKVKKPKTDFKKPWGWRPIPEVPQVYPAANTDSPEQALIAFAQQSDNTAKAAQEAALPETAWATVQTIPQFGSQVVNTAQSLVETLAMQAGSTIIHERVPMPNWDMPAEFVPVTFIKQKMQERLTALEPDAKKAIRGIYETYAGLGSDPNVIEKTQPYSFFVKGKEIDGVTYNVGMFDSDLPYILNEGAKPYFEQFYTERPSTVGVGYMADYDKINAYAEEVFKTDYLSLPGVRNYYAEKYPDIDFTNENLEIPKELYQNDPIYQEFRNVLVDDVNSAIRAEQLESILDSEIQKEFPNDPLIKKLGIRAIPQGTKEIAISFQGEFLKQKVKQMKQGVEEITAPVVEVINSRNAKYTSLIDSLKRKYGYDEATNSMLNPNNFSEEEYNADLEAIEKYFEETNQVLIDLQKQAELDLKDFGSEFDADFTNEFSDAMSRLEFGDYSSKKMKSVIARSFDIASKTLEESDLLTAQQNSFFENMQVQFMMGVGDMWRGVSLMSKLYYGENNALSNYFSDLADYNERYTTSFRPTVSETPEGFSWLSSSVLSATRQGTSQALMALQMIPQVRAFVPVGLTTSTAFMMNVALEAGSVYDEALAQSGNRSLATTIGQQRGINDFKEMMNTLLEAGVYISKLTGPIVDMQSALKTVGLKLVAESYMEAGNEFNEESDAAALSQIYIKGENEEAIRNLGWDVLGIDKLKEDEAKRLAGENVPLRTLRQAALSSQKEIAAEVLFPTVSMTSLGGSVDAYYQIRDEKIMNEAIAVFDKMGYTNFIQNAVREHGKEGAFEIGNLMYKMGKISKDQLEKLNTAIKRIAEYGEVAKATFDQNNELQHAIVSLLEDKYALQAQMEGLETEEAKQQVKDQIKAIDSEIASLKETKKLDGHSVIKNSKTGKIVAVVKNEKLIDMASTEKGKSIIAAIGEEIFDIATTDQKIAKIKEDYKKYRDFLRNIVMPIHEEYNKKERELVAENLKNENITEEEKNKLLENLKKERINNIRKEFLAFNESKNEYVDNLKYAGNQELIDNKNIADIFEIDVNDVAQIDALISNPETSVKTKRFLNQVKDVSKLLQMLFPGKKVTLYKNTQDYLANGGINNSEGTWDTDNNNILIDLNNVGEHTIWHEVMHGALLKAFGDNPDLFVKFKDQIYNSLDENTRQRLDEFVAQYTPEAIKQQYAERGEKISDERAKLEARYAQAEEFLVQLGAFAAMEGVKFKQSTWQKIKNAIFEVLSRLPIPYAQKSLQAYYYDNKRIQDFFNIFNKYNPNASSIEFMATAIEGIAASDISVEQIANGEVAPGTPVISSRGNKPSRKSAISQFFDRSNIAIHPDRSDMSKKLPVKTLKTAIEQHNGAVIVLTSDTTGFGYNKNGEWRWGGIGNMSITDNINNNIVFGTTEERIVTSIYNNAEASNEGNPVLALIMIQHPDAIFGNDWGTIFFADMMRMAAQQKKNDAIESVTNYIKNTAKVITSLASPEENKILTNKNNVYTVEQQEGVKQALAQRASQIADGINAINLDENQENVRKAFLDLFSKYTFAFRKNFIASTVPSEWKQRPTKSYSMRQFAFDNNMGKQAFHELYSEPQLTTLEQLQNENWGYVVGGFTIDVNDKNIIQSVQSKGITHPFFNKKIPGRNPFLLDAIYNVNSNLNDALSPDETRINVSQMAAQSYLPSTRNYASGNLTAQQRREKLLERARTNSFIRNKNPRASLASFEFTDQIFDLFVDNYGYQKVFRTKEDWKAQKIKPIDRGVKVVGKQIIIDDGQEIGRMESYSVILRMMVENWINNDSVSDRKYQGKINELLPAGYGKSDTRFVMAKLRDVIWNATGGSVSNPNYKKVDVATSSDVWVRSFGEEAFKDFSNYYLGREVEMAGGIHRVASLLYKDLNRETYADTEYEVANAEKIKEAKEMYPNMSTYDLAELIRDRKTDREISRINKASKSREEIQNILLDSLQYKFSGFTITDIDNLPNVDPSKVGQISEREFFIDDELKYMVIPKIATLEDQLLFFNQYLLINIQRFDPSLWSNLIKSSTSISEEIKEAYENVKAESLASPYGSKLLSSLMAEYIGSLAKFMTEKQMNPPERTPENHWLDFFYESVNNYVGGPSILVELAPTYTDTASAPLQSSTSLENLAYFFANPEMNIKTDLVEPVDPSNYKLQNSQQYATETIALMENFLGQLQKDPTLISYDPYMGFVVKRDQETQDRYIKFAQDSVVIFNEEANKFNKDMLRTADAYETLKAHVFKIRDLVLDRLIASDINDPLIRNDIYDLITEIHQRTGGAISNVKDDVYNEIRDILTDLIQAMRSHQINILYSPSDYTGSQYQNLVDRLVVSPSPERYKMLSITIQLYNEAIEQIMSNQQLYIATEFLVPNRFPSFPNPDAFIDKGNHRAKQVERFLNNKLLNVQGNTFEFAIPQSIDSATGSYRITINSVKEILPTLIAHFKRYKQRLSSPAINRLGALKASVVEAEFQLQIPEHIEKDSAGNIIRVHPPYVDKIYAYGNILDGGQRIHMSFKSDYYRYGQTPQWETEIRQQNPIKAANLLLRQVYDLPVRKFTFQAAEELNPQQKQNQLRRQEKMRKKLGDPNFYLTDAQYRRDLYAASGERMQKEFFNRQIQGFEEIPLSPAFSSKVIFPHIYSDTGMKAEIGKPFKASRRRAGNFSPFEQDIKSFVENARANNVPDLETFSVLFKKYGFENMRTSSYGIDFMNEYDQFMLEDAKRGLAETVGTVNKRLQGIRNFLDKYLGEIPLIQLVNQLREGVEFLEDDQLNLDMGETMILVDPEQALFTPERQRRGNQYKFYDHEIFKALYEFGVDSNTLASIFGGDMRKTIVRAIDESGLTTNFTEGLEDDARSLKISRSIQELKEMGEFFDRVDPTSIINALLSSLSGAEVEVQVQKLIDDIKQKIEQTREGGEYTTLENELEMALAKSEMEEDYMALSSLASLSGRILRLMRQLYENPENIFFKYAESKGLVIPPDLRAKVIQAAQRHKDARIKLREATNNAKRAPNDDNFKAMREAQIELEKATEELIRLTDNQAFKTSFMSERFNRIIPPALLAPHIVVMSATAVVEVLMRTLNPLFALTSWAADRLTPYQKIGKYTIQSQKNPLGQFATAALAMKVTARKTASQIWSSFWRGSTAAQPMMDKSPASVNIFKDVTDTMFVLSHIAEQIAKGKFGKDWVSLTDVELAELYRMPLVEVENTLKLADGKEYTIAVSMWRAAFFKQSEAMSRLMPLGLDQALSNYLEARDMLNYIDLNKNDNYLGLRPNILSLVNQKAQGNGSTDTVNMMRLLESLYTLGDLQGEGRFNQTPFERKALRDSLFGNNKFLDILGSAKKRVRQNMESNYETILFHRYGIGKKQDATKYESAFSAYAKLTGNQGLNLLFGVAIPFSKVPSNIALLLATRGNPFSASAMVAHRFMKMKNLYEKMKAKYNQEFPSFEDFVGDKSTLILDPTRMIEAGTVKPESRVAPYRAKRAFRAGNYTKSAEVEQDMIDLYQARKEYTDAVGISTTITALYLANMMVVASGAFMGADDDRRLTGVKAEAGLLENEINWTYLKEFYSWFAQQDKYGWTIDEITRASKVFYAKRGWLPSDNKNSVVNLGTIYGYSLGFANKFYEWSQGKTKSKDFFINQQGDFSLMNLGGGFFRTVMKMTPTAAIFTDMMKLGDTKTGVADYEKEFSDLIGGLFGTLGSPYAPALFGRPYAISNAELVQSANLIDPEREDVLIPFNLVQIAWHKMSRTGILYPGTMRSPFYQSRIGLFGEDMSIRKTKSEPGTALAYFESMFNFMSLRTEPLNPKDPKADSALMNAVNNNRQDAIEQLGREIDKQYKVGEFATRMVKYGQMYGSLGGDAKIVSKAMNRKITNSFIITDASYDDVTGENPNVPITLPNDILRDEARILGAYRYSVLQNSMQKFDALDAYVEIATADDEFSDEEIETLKNKIYTVIDEINTELNNAESEYRANFLLNRRDAIAVELFDRGLLKQTDDVDEIQLLINLGVDSELFDRTSEMYNKASKWKPKYTEIGTLNPTTLEGGPSTYNPQQ